MRTSEIASGVETWFLTIVSLASFAVRWIKKKVCDLREVKRGRTRKWDRVVGKRWHFWVRSHADAWN